MGMSKHRMPPLYPPSRESYSMREIVTATMLAEQERQLGIVKQIHKNLRQRDLAA